MRCPEVSKHSGQGWAAKVVQGDLGGQAYVALVARATYIAEVAGTRPAWSAWQPGDTQFVRWGLPTLLT